MSPYLCKALYLSAFQGFNYLSELQNNFLACVLLSFPGRFLQLHESSRPLALPLSQLDGGPFLELFFLYFSSTSVVLSTVEVDCLDVRVFFVEKIERKALATAPNFNFFLAIFGHFQLSKKVSQVTTNKKTLDR